MAKIFLAFLYILSLIPQSAWAESARMASGAPNGRPLDLVRLTAHASPAASTHFTPVKTAPQPASAALRAMPQGEKPAGAAPAEKASARLAEAGLDAAQVMRQSGSAEGDSRRADFTLPSSRRAVAYVPEDAALSRKIPLAPAGHRGPAAPNSRGVKAYLGGVFAAQVANNALTVSLPLVLLHLGQSIGTIGFVTTLTTALDMSGTLASGWLTRRHSPDAILRASTWARAAVLVAIPALLSAGALTAPAAFSLYAADALARGVADTARNTMPVALVGKSKADLGRLSAQTRAAFNLGGIAGPALVGLLALKSFSNAGNWLVAGVFAAAAAAYHLIPRAPPAAASIQKRASVSSVIRGDRFVRLALAASVLISLSPALRALIPAAFSDAVLHAPNKAAWLALAFGFGSTAGSLAYRRLHERVSTSAWLAAGAAGTLVFAAGLLPAALAPMAGAIFVFAALNEMANIALTTSVLERLPEGTEGGVMSLLRFSANATSMVVRGLIGLAFTAAAPVHAFWLIGAGVCAAALAQVWASARLRAVAVAGTLAAGAAAGPKPSPVHGLPGRLIVVEGLDGSGKSTQIELLKGHLEAQGLKVVTTSWNSSELLSETVKKAKRAQALTPDTFALLNAADLTERLNKVILPALQEGAVVLADRYFYTALARDSVRGNDPAWLRGLYASAPRPDLTLYFKLPADTAIGRVMARSEGRLGLSEDFEGDEGPQTPKAGARGLKHYEAGLDLKLHEDPVQNFRLFQTKVTDSYDAQAGEFGFRLVDAAKSREVQHAAVLAQVDKVLGPLASFKVREPRGPESNLFDKDPAQDAENIRRNYLNEKRGAHFYFRNMLLPMQERFAQLLDHAEMPRAFLHGSPHLDNYAKTAQGAAMVDFDRSRVGPYAWDLVRFMVSMSLRQKKEHGFLDPEVARNLRKGYLHGFRHSDRPFSEMRKLKDLEPEKGERSTNEYLKADKKWAREMRQNPLPKNDPDVLALLDGYMKNRNEPNLLKDYFVEEAGRGRGSMGFRDLFLVVLAPKNPRSGQDRLFLNIKKVRSDPDTRWYKSPAPTEGERMRRAAELYAPGWELRPGYTSLKGGQFYVRGLPPMNAKLKKLLKQEELQDLAYAVGTQLGRAHRLSLQDGATPEKLEAHLEKHYQDILAAGETIRSELAAAHERYLADMKKRGLEPKDSGSSDE